MHFCFVDESGTPPGKPNPSKPYFTLGGLIIEDVAWPDVANLVQGFRTRRHLRGELKWRYFSPHNQSPENPMLYMAPAERKALSLEFAEIIAKSGATIIACVTDVQAAFAYASVTDQQQLYHFSYKPISERFQYFLQDADSVGIIVSDHRWRDSDKMLRAHHETLVGKTTRTSSGYDRLIEGLFLQDSIHSVGIQMADFAAGAIHRAYSTGDNQHAAILKPRIRAKPNGDIVGHGIVHHPRAKFRLGLSRD